MPKIEAGMRAEIACFLPSALETAIQSYVKFSEEEATMPDGKREELKKNDAKSFKEHHDACKVCIAHIELLIKLAKWADIPPPELKGQVENAVLQDMIEQAHREP